jgi:phosphoenolpyruvate-protein kinase (PTS system EI component)
MRFSGIAASPGIGVGPIHLIVAEDYAVKDFAIAAERVEDEIAFFE